MRFCLMMILFMLAAGCAGAKVDTTGYAETLEAAIRKYTTIDRPPGVVGEDWPALEDCALKSIISVIPTGDQREISMALSGHYFNGWANELFIKYFWYSPIDGPVVPMDLSDPRTHKNGLPIFANGRPVPPRAREVSAAIRGALLDRCPTLATKYRVIFMDDPAEVDI
ncbi:MAG: hypothetical protein IPK59_18055 [Rhodospirillaceae bacterium]|nr:hypothetical protein [Rhodospirillaceae bacterium]